ncbi:ABC transporter substrate-binding protein [Actinomadura sp. WMMB 499]|uniref:ABC transporter substrate-binding protein n=1 Tax=Actinomadura sp. WMMB 499 TaxID=1219491 RepID=UPI00124505F7|nr:ABC transporter substrate-binding protein [Actinomadura sp. WMMB 499]QFG25671.1 ABC transporter substrate-binding protein [Actinomadura sp. WMMB 499]
MRHAKLAACSAAALLLTTACTAGGTASTGDAGGKPGYAAVADTALPAGGVLKLQTHVDIGGATGLDPQMADVATSWQLMSLVYETLVTVGPDFSIQPLLAERWETPSPTTYVFHLRDGVSFSNGRAMTADDVVGSLERLRGSGAVWSGQLGPVKSVTKTGERTVTVELDEPYTPFLAALANVPAAVLPVKEVEDGSVDLEKEMVGTGPFTVSAHRQDVSWTFERNDGYWAQGKPALDGVEVTIAADEAARVAALQNGRASMAVLGNVDSRTTLAGASGVEVADQATTDFYYLFTNTLKPGSKLADPRVRTALNLAMDRGQIAQVATGGLGKPTAVTPVGLPDACDPSALPSATGDLEKARGLLAEAGAQDLSFTLSVYSTRPAPAVAQVIQQNLERIGVAVDIEQMDEASWAGKVYAEKPEFDAALSWFAGYADPAMAMRWWNPEQAGFSSAFMRPNEELNGLIEAAGEAPAGAGRAEALSAVCAAVDADAQMIPLVTRPATLGYRSDAVSPGLYATEGYGNMLRLITDFRAKTAG